MRGAWTSPPTPPPHTPPHPHLPITNALWHSLTGDDLPAVDHLGSGGDDDADAGQEEQGAGHFVGQGAAVQGAAQRMSRGDR